MDKGGRGAEPSRPGCQLSQAQTLPICLLLWQPEDREKQGPCLPSPWPQSPQGLAGGSGWRRGDLPRRRRALLSPQSYQRGQIHTKSHGHNEFFHSANTPWAGRCRAHGGDRHPGSCPRESSREMKCHQRVRAQSGQDCDGGIMGQRGLGWDAGNTGFWGNPGRSLTQPGGWSKKVSWRKGHLCQSTKMRSSWTWRGRRVSVSRKGNCMRQDL